MEHDWWESKIAIDTKLIDSTRCCFNTWLFQHRNFWGNAGNLTWYRRLADSPRKDPYTNAVLKIGERLVEGFWVSSGFRTFRAAHTPLDTESVPILEMKPTPKSFMPPRITASALVWRSKLSPTRALWKALSGTDPSNPLNPSKAPAPGPCKRFPPNFCRKTGHHKI